MLGGWLHVLPITAHGLCMDEETELSSAHGLEPIFVKSIFALEGIFALGGCLMWAVLSYGPKSCPLTLCAG